MGANVLAFAAGCLLLAGLLAFGATGKWKPAAVLVAVGSLSLPVTSLFFAPIPSQGWTVVTTACITAAFFIAWQVRQKQAGKS